MNVVIQHASIKTTIVSFFTLHGINETFGTILELRCQCIET